VWGRKVVETDLGSRPGTGFGNFGLRFSHGVKEMHIRTNTHTFVQIY
jgi:hypothetical protein